MTTDALTVLRPQAIDRQDVLTNPSLVYLSRLGAGSRPAQAAALRDIARMLTSGQTPYDAFPWHELRYEHVQALRTKLTEQYAPATANRYLSALKGVLREAWRLGLLNAEDYHRTTDITGVKAARLPAGRALSGGEIRTLFETLAEDRAPAGSRDAALLAVMYGAGLRRAEVVNLNLGDYDRDSGTLTIRSGKGDKDRVVYATNGAADALADWLDVRPATDDDAPLFLPIKRDGKQVERIPRRLTSQAVYNVLVKRAQDSGVKAFSPHDLRRSMISDLLDHGADISTVQRLAGHANVTTTQRYDRRGEATKKEAAQLLHVPYRRK